MYIKRDINIVVTDEEREILNKARKILMDFESECSTADEEALQEMYEDYIGYTDHQIVLPTTIDLLTTILGTKTYEI